MFRVATEQGVTGDKVQRKPTKVVNKRITGSDVHFAEKGIFNERDNKIEF
jgi:hypothetical protein